MVFHLGHLGIPAHLLFETLGYTLGFQLYRYRLKQVPKEALPSGEQRLILLLSCVIGAVIMAKLLGWLQTPFVLDAHGLRHWIPPGKTIVGGLLGGWIGIEFAKWKLGIQNKTGDAYIWPLALGLMLGRVGCFLTGLQDNTHGLPIHLPWAVNFGDGVLRHPTQLYEIIFVLLLTLIIHLSFWDREPTGSRFRLWMTAYLGFRFVSDWIKPVMHLYLGLSAIQWACLLGLIWSLYSWQRMKSRKPGNAETLQTAQS